MRTFTEFFAGGGMASEGLGSGWSCLLANDFSPMKAAVYRENHGSAHFVLGDVGALKAADVPASDLAWGSTPCQDVSLAGNQVGFGRSDGEETRSGAFWKWWGLIRAMHAAGKAPPVIVFENVVGALTSNDGKDFAIVVAAFASLGYRFGAIIVDARLFLPQSRPRLFVVGVAGGVQVPREIVAIGPQDQWHPTAVQRAFDRLPEDLRSSWQWWAMPTPMGRRATLASIVEDEPVAVTWHSASHTKTLVSQMSPANRAKLKAAQAIGKRQVGCIYRRTRDGSVKSEVRFDGVAGCLRTPSGGSSRQTVIIVEGNLVRSRLLSPRELARLMGLREGYILPANYNDAYHVCGDGVAVPVVRHLARFLLEPLADSAARASRVFAAA
jgi:DNA (cytosine-5)-methyltransferase 1